MMKKVGFFGILVCMTAAFSQENYSLWSHYKNITVNTSASGANVTGNVLDFPMLVRLTSANADVFAAAATGGADIRFTKSDGVTHIAYQIDHWDSTGQNAAIWVHLDTAYGNSSTQSIRMYWGKSGSADSSNGGVVFDTTTNGYKFVTHMSTLTPTDVTVKNWPVAQNYTPTTGLPETDTTGVIGGAVSFLPGGITASSGAFIGQGSNTTAGSYTLTGSSTALGLPAGSNYTISAWANAHQGTGTVAAGMVYCQSSRYVLADTLSGSNYVWELGEYVSGVGKEKVDVSLTPGWHYLVGTRSGSTMTLYVDGVPSSNVVTETANVTVTAKSAGIGRDNHALANADYAPSAGNGMYFSGAIDEVQFSDSARSSNWVNLSYQTQQPGSTVASLGITTNNVVPGSPTSVTALPGNDSAIVSWAAPVSNGSPAITGYTATALAGGVATSFTCTTTGALTCTIGGLTNGTSYTFTVTATNSVGTSASSVASAVVVPSVLTPSLTSSPVSDTVVLGGVASFTVTATGSGTLTYQWQKGGVNLVNSTGHVSGATSATLKDSGSVIGDTGSYTVVVTNTVGSNSASATTIPVRLVINAPPVITTQPVSDSVSLGSNAVFTVVATGSGTLTYQWQKGGVNLVNSAGHISGATSATLTDSGSVLGDTGSYTVVVTSSLGSTVNGSTSNVVRLKVTAVLLVASSPAAQVVNLGATVKFGVSLAKGAVTPIIYTWVHTHGIATDTLKHDTLSVLTDTLTLVGAPAGDTGSYKAVVSNASGTLVSGSAVLTFNAAPTIVTSPANLSTTTGLSVKFAVVVSGTAPFTYKWVDGTGDTVATHASSSLTTDTLTLANVTGNATYKCVVTNVAGQAVSGVATLTVNPLALVSNSMQAFAIRTVGSSLMFQLPSGASFAKITLMDMEGHSVWSNSLEQGGSTLAWHGTTTSGGSVNSGIYIVHMALFDSQRHPAGMLQRQIAYIP